MQKLKISENRRYFEKEDGTPFIWLADTCWTMPQRLKWDDAEYFMQKRKQQGFTMLQMVALDPEQDRLMHTPAGDEALIDNKLENPNELYFRYLDYLLERAEHYGFYVLLLPVWGELVVGHNWMGQFSEKIVTENNAYEYARWIGERYKNRTNIIWCLGGDRQPFHLGEDYRTVWRRMAEGLAKGVLGCDLSYNVPDPRWQELPLTYHACHEAETGECSTMSYWTEEEAWISFIMLQSGHGLTPKNYELVEKEYARGTYPVFDGEPAYEKMPTSWPVIDGYHGDTIVRNRAYWSLFAGSFGHTYGHGSVWCMISEKETDAFRNFTWFEALSHPGAGQIKFLRDFLESIDLTRCIPAQQMLLSQLQAPEKDDLTTHRQACMEESGSFACIYFPAKSEELVDISALKEETVSLWWFSPRDGKCYDMQGNAVESPAQTIQAGTKTYMIQTPKSEFENDWICVLEAGKELNTIPGTPQCYGEAEQEQEIKKVFEW